MIPSKLQNQLKRQARTRAKIRGTADRPRLTVFRSNRYLSAQLIDDMAGVTLAAASSRGLKGKAKQAVATQVGEALAAAAKAKNISLVVFDRGRYRFTGKVKQLADGARAGGLQF